MSTARLGILGGTFDPVHLGHLVLAEQAREQLGLTRVLWVPAGEPWRKAGRVVAAAKHRLAMVEIAIAGGPGFELCTVEVDRPGPSYTVETLAGLRDEDRDCELFLLLGMDALEDLPNWHEPDRLVQLATLAVAVRSGERLSAEALELLLPGLGECVVWVEMTRIDITATDLRRRVAQGRSVRYLVPNPVEAYIREQSLYRRGL